MDAAHDFRQPLGQLLVEEGLITAEQLDSALRAQYGTDKQLGAVVVELGFVAPGVVEAALAEQEALTASQSADEEAGAPDALAPWRVALEQRDTMLVRYRAELTQREAQLAERDAQLTERDERIDVMERHLEAATARADALQARVNELEAAPAPVEPEPVPAETAHVLFVPASDGYRLVSREGPAPAPGERLEHEGRAYVVERYGPSPVPGSRLRCAILADGRTLSP